MKELEAIVANNITELRKSQKWTQAELAAKLNYSDKSISKWERGDALPDVKVLNNMAELFGVTLDYFVKENAPLEKEKYIIPRTEMSYRIGIGLLGVCFIWLLVTVIYVYSAIYTNHNYWTLFIWAVPASLILLHRFDRKWNKAKLQLPVLSVLCWTLLTAVYLQFLYLNMWPIYFIGIPLQIALILFELLRHLNHRSKGEIEDLKQ